MTDQDKNLRVRLVSPDGVIWEGTSSFVVLPALDGEVGIHPGHAPLLARLGPGEARIHTPGAVRYYALFSGFLEVARDEVQVLVGRALPPESIDPEQARRDLEELGATGLKDVDRHEEDVARRRQAQTLIKVAARR